MTLLPLALAGWLKQQLLTQASGLSGHLSQFWADVSNSSWLGGGADTGLHERTPYWLNGFVPLAYQLQDRSLISMVSTREAAAVSSLCVLCWFS